MSPVKLREVLPECPFCRGQTDSVYKMGEYDICMCTSCGTGQVFPMPDVAALQEFYKGFLFGVNIGNLEVILKTAPRLFNQLDLPVNAGLKMLDVGGGGGFYAKAFECSGFGESTYIDLDSESCKFAKNEVGLHRVLHGDAASLDAEAGTYDFIMCRHLIEHLIDPTGFILKLIGMLTAGGTLLIVCPNGDSLEYFAYPKSNLRQRIKKISVASHVSRSRVISKLLFGQMLHGIDPPRHLWAVSRQGMKRFLNEHKIHGDLTTHSLTDQLHSPYHRTRTKSQRISALLGDFIASKLTGGTHLSVAIKKSRKTQEGNVA